MEFLEKKDAFELLSSLCNQQADLIILDPNYEDWSLLIDKGIIELALTKLKKTGNLILFTKKPYDFVVRKKIQPFFLSEIIWKYKPVGSWVSRRKPLMTYQTIYICAKNCSESFFSIESGMKYSKNTINGVKTQMQFKGYKEETKPFVKNKGGKQIEDLLYIPRKRQGLEGFIPSKPLSLCSILLNTYCPKKGLVVDPFCGGGNFAKTAKILGFSFVAGDIDERCVEFAARNIASLNVISGRKRNDDTLTLF